MPNHHEMNFKNALEAAETAQRLTMYQEGTHADYILLKPAEWQKIINYLYSVMPLTAIPEKGVINGSPKPEQEK